MSSDRAALLERFRAGLLARVERIESLLEQVEAGAANGERKAALGELHTLKGEGRMLGLRGLAELAHALETWLGAEGATDQALRALDAMRKSLSGALPAEITEALLEAERLELDELATGAAHAANGNARGDNGAARDENGDARDENGDARDENGDARDENGDAHAAHDETDDARPETADADAEPPVELAARPNGKARRYVQVDAGAIDDLCERLAELSALFGRVRGRTLGVVSSLPGGSRAHTALVEDFARVTAIVTDSTTRAWSLRLVPVEPMLRELARHARNLARECGKDVSVIVESRGVELERNVLDTLWDSLLHLAQNAVDHGLEPNDERGEKPAQGSVVIVAQAAGPNVVLSVEDDGRGVDPEVLRAAALRAGRGAEIAGLSDEEVLDLLFEHGFSTRTEVSHVSGRGVGLAVVRRQVEALGGRVRIESRPGVGTLFSLTVPFTVTKERSLIIAVGGGLYAFPARSVRAVLGSHELPPPSKERHALFRYRNESIPIVPLARALELPADTPDTAGIIVDIGGRSFALTVPNVVGDVELIRRPADALLGSLTGVAATALLDDGRLVLMLDIAFLRQALRDATRRPVPTQSVRAGPRARRILVVDDSPVVCSLVREILVSAGFSVEVVNDGTEALLALRDREPDLVLSDVEMPKMGGFELLAEIRKRTQRLPVIMLTTRGSVEDRHRATELGANAYLLKTGFASEALLDVIRRFLPAAARAAVS
jgi:chemotaxis protein histidine kinase CheA/CheY-like chemotaxis protein